MMPPHIFLLGKGGLMCVFVEVEMGSDIAVSGVAKPGTIGPGVTMIVT